MTIKMNLLPKEEEKLLTKWRSFIDRLSDPSCIVLRNKQILWANSAFKRSYLGADGSLNRLDELFIVPDIDQNYKDGGRRILKGVAASHKWLVEIDQTLLQEEKDGLSLTIVRNPKSESVSPDDNGFHEKILDNLFQEIVVLDRSFKFVYFSSATLKDIELRKWLIGRSDYDYCKKRGIDQKVADKRFEHYQKAFDSQKVVDWVEHFPMKVGGVKKIFRKITPIIDNEGHVEFLLVNSFMESEKAVLDHEYEVSKKRFDAMVQNAPEAVVLFDGSNQYCIDANHAATALFGRSKVELLKSSANDLSFHIQPNVEDHVAVLNQKFAKALKEPEVKFKWIVQDKEGKLTPTMVHLVRLPSSNKSLIRASFTDISERLIAEQTQKQYQLLFENSQQGILVYNISKREVISCNSMACSIYGFSKEEFHQLHNGHNSPEFQSNGQRSGDVIKAYTKEIFDNGTAQMEVEQLRKDGSLITLTVIGHKLKANEDEVMVSVFIDRTEYIQNRTRIKQQSARFRKFVAQNPSAVAMLDTDMNYILVSEEWKKSYSDGKTDLEGLNHYELHPEIPTRWKKGHAEALRGKVVKHNRDSLIVDGKKEWFRWEVRPWYSHDDEVGGIFIYSENITDQVEAEDKLRRQSVRFKSVFESGSIGWLECNVESIYKFVSQKRKAGKTHLDAADIEQNMKELLSGFRLLNYNRQIGEIFGVSEDEPQSKRKILEVLQKTASVVLVNEVEAMFNQERSFESEFTITNLHGEQRNLYVSVNYPEDDDYSRVLYSVLDITDLRQSVKALRQSEQRYKSMFEDNRLAVAYTNEEEDYFKVNQAFLNMFGYSQQELQEMKHEDFALPKYVKETKENYKKLRKCHIRSFNMEKEYYHRDGTVIHANLSVTGLYDFMGHYFGNVAIIENISEKREIYAKLNEQNQQLKVMNKELDRFVYSAAHDLRAPLANVKGLAGLIKTEEISEQASSYADMQLNSIEKLDGFIKSLVNYLKNNRHEVQPSKVDFHKSIPELIEHYRYGEKSQHIKFKTDIKQDTDFYTDPRRLEIVLSNLVSNAIRYSDPKKDREIRIGVEVGKKKANISIWDNGIGISKDEIDKIFKLFFRSSKSSEGTGIGLYLVKETVGKLEGKISVESVEGEWTKFMVKLKSFEH